MLEARTFLKSLEGARKTLEAEGAIFKGEYVIHDVIYKSLDPNKTLAQEFLRLRHNKKNIWEEKDFIVAIKNTEVREVGKNSIIPIKEGFDTEVEANKYIEQNLLDRFEYDYEFDRIGWQYDLGEDQVDLEDIEGHFSIEVKSKTEEGIKRLLKIFDMVDALKGPSVVAIKEILNR